MQHEHQPLAPEHRHADNRILRAAFNHACASKKRGMRLLNSARCRRESSCSTPAARLAKSATAPAPRTPGPLFLPRSCSSPVCTPPP
eukprot:3403598-Rhodomonas_salina.1